MEIIFKMFKNLQDNQTYIQISSLGTLPLLRQIYICSQYLDHKIYGSFFLVVRNGWSLFFFKPKLSSNAGVSFVPQYFRCTLNLSSYYARMLPKRVKLNIG